MEYVNIKINGVEISAPAGSTILEAARLANIEIPTLCYLKEINEIGACRMCVVEVKGARSLSDSLRISGQRRDGSLYQYAEGGRFQTEDAAASSFQPRQKVSLLCEKRQLRAAEALP